MVELPVPPLALATFPADAPVQATSTAAGGALPAASPLLVSRNKLKTVLINPMCTWAAKLKTPELYALLFNPQYPSLDSVSMDCPTCLAMQLQRHDVAVRQRTSCRIRSIPAHSLICRYILTHGCRLQVTTWSSNCASLYTGVGQRMFERRGEVISYADVLVVLACEEMYMQLGPAVVR